MIKRLKKIVLLALVSVLLLSTVLRISFIPPVGARTWTVDDDGAADFSRIQEAVNSASPGDTIHVYNGTYREHLYISKPLRLMDEDKRTTIIDGGGEGIVVEIFYTENVTIEGFKITGSGSEWIYLWTPVAGSSYPEAGIAILRSHRCVIKNNIIRGNFFGICLYGLSFGSSSNNSIVDNIIANNQGGLALGYATRYNLITRNLIANHTDMGLLFDGDCVGDLAYHNDFINNRCNAGATRSEVYLDNGYPTGGNYWSDYNGTDLYSGPGQNVSGSDRIGDTSYTPFPVELPNFRDNYPLMEPILKTDVNADGQVNVKDLFAVAKAFGSYLGHPMWEPACDMNGDDKIDIRDVFAVAKDFGKEW